ncbi:ATP-dependent RNA helicase HrpA [Microbulbifer thermotolerans]|uniref:ATP-dependent RNA helicase HrpA n=1 Tax=Microbulbifer thermotolerans TaxID=252514 RepID=UPI00224A747B|nr:ATP-dependent RNA helicase HrpA [Microbulbifer thermotolerans]MCX2835576.1 ATP-dependent RNA helicase HrpA [Microbulbifer thermotolerans]MCX2842948.1 ATP-dependent RNA helicase HrpA [Microbulbifer thermotolerans]
MKHPETATSLTAVESRIAQCMGRDRYRLRKSLSNARRRIKAGKPADRMLAQIKEQLETSLALVEARRQKVPEIRWPEGLPVVARRDEIAELIAKHQVVVVAGETGSGKTTQLPKICLQLGRGITGQIGHTQPRRIAARTVANRIAEELGQPLGESVGYQVRFTDHSSEHTHIKLMTDGILLAEIQRDPLLNQYDTLIVDEAHERSLNIDFLLGYLKTLLPKRPDLKLIITSATIDLEKFSQHFDGAPIIEVTGRTYPVEIRYRPPLDSDQDLNEQVVAAVEELLEGEKSSGRRGGDILVFMSGEREIRECHKALRDAQLANIEILPLYARLSLAEQAKVFHGHKGRRIVLATNVAETSITVPGIRYVIDPGTARISRYSYRSKIQRLPVEPISQASANQRAGRCGRVSAGICVRLYDEKDFEQRAQFTDAEILRTNLAAVILQMLQLRIGDIRDFPFVDPPDQRLINDGYKLLQELQALDARGKVTPLGRTLSRLPLDPRLGRMLAAAAARGSLREILIIVSALAVQDPRERPAEKRQAADEKHRQWQHQESDFLSYVQLWEAFEAQRQALSQNQLRKWCQRNFLSWLRMREWRDIHHQLRLACRELKLKENAEAADYAAVHAAIVPGLLGNIGVRDENKEFLGCRNRRFHIFPGSGQFKKPPRWVVAAQLLETSRLFAHTVAKIEPDWVLAAAEHLVKRNYSEPHYDTRSGRVMAFEKISLYGLVLVEKRRVHFGKLDPKISREVFIRQALVEQRYRGKGGFFEHYRELLAELEDLEAKSRRRDILVDDEVIFRFFDERVPGDIINLAGFEHWRKRAEEKEPHLLYVPRELLMQHTASNIGEAQFPDELSTGGMVFPLAYHFEPGAEDDGVSVQVPVGALHQVPAARLTWLVPGLLRDKCIALIKALPKQWRKYFVPVPAAVDKALPRLQPDQLPLWQALAQELKRQTAQEVPDSAWEAAEASLEDFYRFNIQVLDEEGELLDQGRNLPELQARYKDRVQKELATAGDDFEREGITHWDFGDLPETHILQQGALKVRAYPTLIEAQDSVSLKLLDNPYEAQRQSRAGICRLALLHLPEPVKYLRKELLRGKELGLSAADLGKREDVADDILLAAARELFWPDEQWPRTEADFLSALEKSGELVSVAQEIADLLVKALAQLVPLRKLIKQQKNLALAMAVGDIQQQLAGLFYRGFLFDTPLEWLRQYSRYLKGISLRLEKAALDPNRDRRLQAELHGTAEPYLALAERHTPRSLAADTQLAQYRWMLEEFRVSLFAQTLKTLRPVSAKRLRKLWEEIEPAVCRF